MTEETKDRRGALTAALAKAQASFPTIPRDKQVTVQTKTGGSYTFKYAPLDTIIAAVRGPLAENGLAISQIIDGDDLVTMLLHDGGGRLSGRMPLPRQNGDTVQALGSAITYLRRYALQAVLGIAAEEDDDGNRASGNKVSARKHPGLVDGDPPEPETTHDGGLVGVAQLGKDGGTSTGTDFMLREEASRGNVIGFRLTQGRKGIKVLAFGPIAAALATQNIIGERVTCWGTMADESFTNAKGTTISYQVMHLERIATPDVVIPAEAAPEPLWPDPDEAAAIAEAEKAEALA